MPTLVVAHLRQVEICEELLAYIERIEASFEPYGGRFLVHGAQAEVLDGAWVGDLVIAEFPNRANALAWYHSAEYQALLPLRTRHSEGAVILIDTVPEGYRAHKTAEMLRGLLGGS